MLRKQSNSLEKLKSLITSESNKKIPFMGYSKGNSVFPRAGTKLMLYQVFLKCQQGQSRQPQHSWPDIHAGMVGCD